MTTTGRANAARISSKVSGSPGHYHEFPTTSTFQFNYDATTTMADPGSGDVRTDTAAGVPTSTVALSKITALGIDCSPVIGQLQVGDQIYVQQTDDATNWARFTVRAPVTYNASTWFLIPVTTMEMHGTVGSNKPVLLELSHWSVQSLT